jgi:hypothetical protein
MWVNVGVNETEHLYFRQIVRRQNVRSAKCLSAECSGTPVWHNFPQFFAYVRVHAELVRCIQRFFEQKFLLNCKT